MNSTIRHPLFDHLFVYLYHERVSTSFLFFLLISSKSLIDDDSCSFISFFLSSQTYRAAFCFVSFVFFFCCCCSHLHSRRCVCFPSCLVLRVDFTPGHVSPSLPLSLAAVLFPLLFASLTISIFHPHILYIVFSCGFYPSRLGLMIYPFSFFSFLSIQFHVQSNQKDRRKGKSRGHAQGPAIIASWQHERERLCFCRRPVSAVRDTCQRQCDRRRLIDSTLSNMKW